MPTKLTLLGTFSSISPWHQCTPANVSEVKVRPKGRGGGRTETPRRKRCEREPAAARVAPPLGSLAPPFGTAPSRAAHPRAPPADGSESEAERLTSRRHRQTSPRVRRVNQPERRRRRRRRQRQRQQR
uniref:Uncharacterized protein n=1 Tax=Rangifer tarandus platyrhynchus TaxID=3082113 RepID=A0ACB0ETA4_RANTA|nr:unnamed protein product [Rangifer tarandus platyrhynchus]